MKKFIFQDTEVFCTTQKKIQDGNNAGEWITLSEYSDEEELKTRLLEIHKDERNPEFVFTDKNNFPDLCGVSTPTWESVIQIIDIASELWDPRYDEEIVENASYVMEDFDKASARMIKKWLDHHLIGKKSYEEIALEEIEEANIPNWMIQYIDLEMMGEGIIDDKYDQSGNILFSRD